MGNRTQLTSTLAPVPAGLFNYDANDRFTAGDTYDANGNAVSSGGLANVYDFENHLIQKGGVALVYDGDGNRVAKTVAGATTKYLVDTENPTGYAQVIAELTGPLGLLCQRNSFDTVLARDGREPSPLVASERVNKRKRTSNPRPSFEGMGTRRP